MNELISIIVRAYNAGKYIDEALKSIICNTYKGPIEIIVCYDLGSNDNTLEKIKYIMSVTCQPNRKIKLVKHEHMSPFRSLLKYGFNEASGTYVSILDYDNLYPSKHIEIMFKRALDSNKMFLFVKDIFFEDITLKNLYSSKIPKNPYNIVQLIQGNYIDGNCMFIHKGCLHFIVEKLKKLEHRIYDWIFEDWLIALIAIKHFPCLYVDDSYVLYRVHNENLTGVKASDPRTNVLTCIRNISTLMALYELEKENLTKAELKSIEKTLIKNISAIPKFLGDVLEQLLLIRTYSKTIEFLIKFSQ